MSAPSWFLAGLLAGAAAMLGVVLLSRASSEYRGRKILLAGGITAVAAVALIAGMSLTIVSRQTVLAPGDAAMTASQPPPIPSSGEMPPPPATPSTSAMPPASVMARILAMPSAAGTRSAEPMDQAAAKLATRLERQGGTAADWNLLAQAYDFLGRPEDARRARARATETGAGQRAP